MSKGTAVNNHFEALKMRLVGWNYDPVGIILDVYIGDRLIKKQLITREQAISISKPPLKLIVALLVLDLKDENLRRARFVLLRYL